MTDETITIEEQQHWDEATITGDLAVVDGRVQVDFPLGHFFNKVHLYPFDEGDGGTVADNAGSLDGDIEGASWVSDDGRGDAYLDFDGVSDRVIVPHSEALEGDTITVNFWLRTDGFSDDTVLAKTEPGGSAGNQNFSWYFRGDQDPLQFRISWGDDTLDRLILDVDAVIEDGEWHMITGVYDDDALTGDLYVDAELQESGTLDQPMIERGEDVSLGASVDGSRANDIDVGQLQFFDEALDETDVSTLLEEEGEYYE